MGTRSTITFAERYEDEIVPLVTIYQQYDGFIHGVGRDLAKWLNKRILINGISHKPPMSGDPHPEDQTVWRFANGCGCLAAKYIADMKRETGGLYITRLDDIEEYNYKVIVDFVTKRTVANDCIEIVVTNWKNEVIFDGTPQELIEFDNGEEEYYCENKES